MKSKLLIILILPLMFFGCSKDDDNGNNDGNGNNCLTCGGLIICKIDDEPNKVIVKAYGSEETAELPDGKTFKDINCENTLEMVGLEVD